MQMALSFLPLLAASIKTFERCVSALKRYPYRPSINRRVGRTPMCGRPRMAVALLVHLRGHGQDGVYFHVIPAVGMPHVGSSCLAMKQMNVLARSCRLCVPGLGAARFYCFAAVWC